jgi:uncharacterized protein (UPF0332 family)
LGEEVKEKIRLNLERSEDALKEAESLQEEALYMGAANRAYYAAFYAASALLLTKSMEFTKHSAVISTFGQSFVKTGEIEEDYHVILRELFEARQVADYDLYNKTDEETARKLLDKAKKFVNRVKDLVK